MRKVLLFIIFVFCVSEGIRSQEATEPISQETVQYDEDGAITPLKLDTETLDKYKDDPDFDYTELNEEDGWWSKFTNWISRMWYRFWEWLLGDLNSVGGFVSFLLTIAPYLILGTLIVFIVWLFYKMNPGARMLKSKEQPGVFFTEEEEIIRTGDIQKLIDKALLDEDYRLAVRYYYLLILKRLTEAEIIDYEFDKTNSEYTNEINSEKLNLGFRKVTNLYDYIWYGSFEVTPTDFRKAQNTFVQLEHNIPKTID